MMNTPITLVVPNKDKTESHYKQYILTFNFHDVKVIHEAVRDENNKLLNFVVWACVYNRWVPIHQHGPGSDTGMFDAPGAVSYPYENPLCAYLDSDYRLKRWECIEATGKDVNDIRKLSVVSHKLGTDAWQCVMLSLIRDDHTFKITRRFTDPNPDSNGGDVIWKFKTASGITHANAPGDRVITVQHYVANHTYDGWVHIGVDVELLGLAISFLPNS